MNIPKFKIGETVKWRGSNYVIKSVKNFKALDCWIYDIYRPKAINSYYFTGVAERDLKTE